MNTKYTLPFMLVISILIYFAGCMPSMFTKRSGFLVNYSSLKPETDDPNVLFHRNAELSLKNISEQYSALMVDPIAVYFHPNVIGRAVKPDDLKDLTDYFHRELTSGLSKRFTVVDFPGPKVARLRIAVTGVTASHFRLTIHPTLTAIDLEHAAMEFELIDSKTAGRIAALTDSRSHDVYTKFDDLTIKKHSQAIIDGWIKEILQRLAGIFKVSEPTPNPKKE